MEKEVGSDKMPSPCQCILSEVDTLLGQWFGLRFSSFHLLNPDPGLSRADLWACAPVEQGTKWKERYQARGHKLGATDVFCVPYTLPKNDCGESLNHA